MPIESQHYIMIFACCLIFFPQLKWFSENTNPHEITFSSHSSETPDFSSRPPLPRRIFASSASTRSLIVLFGFGKPLAKSICAPSHFCLSPAREVVSSRQRVACFAAIPFFWSPVTAFESLLLTDSRLPCCVRYFCNLTDKGMLLRFLIEISHIIIIRDWYNFRVGFINYGLAVYCRVLSFRRWRHLSGQFTSSVGTCTLYHKLVKISEKRISKESYEPYSDTRNEFLQLWFDLNFEWCDRYFYRSSLADMIICMHFPLYRIPCADWPNYVSMFKI